MIAVIPAAGMATRLRPLTADRPKCLLEAAGKPLLRRTLEGLRANGITETAIVTGYMSRMVEDYLAIDVPEGMEVRTVYNPRYETTNNIYSLYLAAPFAEGKEMLLIDSDIIFDPATVGKVVGAEAPDALALVRHPLGEEEIKVIADADMRVREISKTCSIEDAIGESVGIEKMSAEYTAALFPELRRMVEQEGLDNVFYERAFERLIPQGHTFTAVDTTGMFAMELDTPDDFANALQLLPKQLV